AAKLAPVNVRDVVMPRQALVDEAVIRRHEIENVAIPVDDALEEQLDLAHHRPAQVVVEVGELERVRDFVAQVAEIQPLSGEVTDERLGLRIGDHALHLAIEYSRISQLTVRRGIEQFLVRNAAPDEEG